MCGLWSPGRGLSVGTARRSAVVHEFDCSRQPAWVKSTTVSSAEGERSKVSFVSAHLAGPCRPGAAPSDVPGGGERDDVHHSTRLGLTESGLPDAAGARIAMRR